MKKGLVVAVALAAGSALAQVNITNGRGSSVEVGAEGVQVKKGKKQVVVDGEGVTATRGDGDSGESSAVIDAQGNVTGTSRSGKTVKVSSGAVDTGEGEGEGSGSASAVSVDGDTVEINGAGGKYAHTCQPGQSVEISGASQVVSLTGPCQEVEVSGASNVVTIEAAGAIEVSGMKNKVTWRSGLKGRDPKRAVSGLGNQLKRSQ